MNGSIARKVLLQSVQEGLDALKCPKCRETGTRVDATTAYCSPCRVSFVLVTEMLEAPTPNTISAPTREMVETRLRGLTQVAEAVDKAL